MRVNLDSKALTDPRFKRAGKALACSWQEVLGRCVVLWFDCYEHRSATRTHEDIDIIAERDGFAKALVNAGLATVDGELVRICGVTERIAFLLTQGERGRLGGLARAKRTPSERLAPPVAALAQSLDLDLPLDPDPDQAPSQPQAHDPVRALAERAVLVINEIGGSKYRADSEETLKSCKKLAKEKIAPDQLEAAIRHVAMPWVGTKVADKIRPATLLQMERVKSALEDIRAGNTGKPIENGNSRVGRVEPVADRTAYEQEEAPWSE